MFHLVTEITKRLMIFQNYSLPQAHKSFNMNYWRPINKVMVISSHAPSVLLQNLNTVLNLWHQARWNYIFHPRMMHKSMLFSRLSQTKKFLHSHAAYHETFCLKNAKLEKNCHWQGTDVHYLPIHLQQNWTVFIVPSKSHINRVNLSASSL